MAKGQPFLYRPFHEIEIELVREWVDFFNNPSRDLIGARNVDFDNSFRSHLTSRGYYHATLRPTNGQGLQAFQNLFIAKPAIDLVSAVRRTCGNDIVLTPIEKRLAFREFVEHFRARADATHPLPTLNDFDRAHQDRLFLPNTGVICPSRSPFCRPALPLSTKQLFVYYTQFFDLPREISFDDLATILPEKFEFVRNAYTKMTRYREELERQGYGSLPELEFPVGDNVNEFHEMAARASTFFSTVDAFDLQRQAILKEFDNRYGGIDREISPEERPKPLSVHPKIHRQKNVLSPEEVRKVFIATWQLTNPDGYKPGEGILADPPLAKWLKDVRDTQYQLIRRDGALSDEICSALKIPSFVVPTGPEISNYEGANGGRGYAALLRDIEDALWPAVESSLEEIGDSSIGIVFTNKIQLSQLKRHFMKEQPFYLNHTPRAVVRDLIHRLEKVESSQVFIHPTQAVAVTESGTNQQRVQNLEDALVDGWPQFYNKIHRRFGALTDDEIFEKYVRQVTRDLDPRCFSRDADEDMRLFRSVRDGSMPYSFEEGLRKSIVAKFPPGSIEVISDQKTGWSRR